MTFVAFAMMAGAFAQEPKSPAHLISAETLKASLAADDWRIVDVRNEVKDYWAWHIPGAVYVNPESLRWTRGGVPVRMMPAEALAAYLGELGISPDIMVIIYGEDNKSTAATFLAAALEDIGHAKYAILEGGFAAWQKSGGSVATDNPKLSPVSYPIAPTSQKTVYASQDEVNKALADGSAIVIDARSAAQYAGESGDFPRNGHIPGAVNVAPSQLTTEAGDWKSVADLQAAFREAGVTGDKPVIVYCNSGRSSSQAWFALNNIAGMENVKIYNGSFNEWAGDQNNPVATGKEPGALAAGPAAGSIAPGFTAKDQNGKDVSLSDFKGKWVVLYFYPKADTSGCTKEACSFSDNVLSFTNENTVIIGVSGDNVEAQKAFADKYDLQITLLADPENKIMSAYGVDNKPGEWQGQPFVFARRATFLIDPDGKIAHLWPKVSVAGHTEEVQAKLAELKK